jgi:hypothetical protein
MFRFGEFVNHFTILARRILSSDRLTNLMIDDFTDALRELLETMPETLQFENFHSEVPDWPLNVMATGTLRTFSSSIWSLFPGACARQIFSCHDSDAPEALISCAQARCLENISIHH